jgi:hypothetical protein
MLPAEVGDAEDGVQTVFAAAFSALVAFTVNLMLWSVGKISD